MKILRYVVFGGMDYYPSGGFEDYLNSFDDSASALAFANIYLLKEGIYHWAHIYDLYEGKMYAEFETTQNGILGPSPTTMGSIKRD